MRLLVFSLLGLGWFGCSGAASFAFKGEGGSTTTGGGGATITTTTDTWFTTSFTTTSVSTTTTGGGGGSSSSLSGATTSSSGAGGSPASTSGDCHHDADCPSGHCVAVTPGGFQVCLVAPALATACTSALDQCCPATQILCAGGLPCYTGPLVPVCSGIPMPTYNVCGKDQCAKDVDCPVGQLCAPAGTLGLKIRACVAAHCKLDADCTAHPGGTCAPVQEPCCAATAGLERVYPTDDGCRKNADCPPTASQPSRYCAPDATAGVASCLPGGPVCPA